MPIMRYPPINQFKGTGLLETGNREIDIDDNKRENYAENALFSLDTLVSPADELIYSFDPNSQKCIISHTKTFFFLSE